jgi:hypothetical protein
LDFKSLPIVPPCRSFGARWGAAIRATFGGIVAVRGQQQRENGEHASNSTVNSGVPSEVLQPRQFAAAQHQRDPNGVTKCPDFPDVYSHPLGFIDGLGLRP